MGRERYGDISTVDSAARPPVSRGEYWDGRLRRSLCYRPRCARAERRGALEIWISPVKGIYISKIRKIAPGTANKPEDQDYEQRAGKRGI